MKYIFILFFLIAFSLKSQTLKTETDTIKFCLFKAGVEMEKSHKQFQTGVALYGLGMFFGLAGTSLYNGDGNSKNAGVVTLAIGGGFTLASIIVMIDSHKYIARSAYYMKLASGGLGIGYSF